MADSDSFFDAQARIFSRIKAAPHLQEVAAKKLLAVAESLEAETASAPAETESVGKHPIGDLAEAFNKFKIDKFSKEERYQTLKRGQWPKFMIITCADSRVAPATVLGLEPGEAFVIRNVANLVPAYEKGGYPSVGSALEYAVKHLKVKNIIVNGHHSCGGIANLLHTQGGKANCNHEFVEDWTNIAADVYTKTEAELKDAPADEKLRFAEREAVNLSLANVLTYPFAAKAVEDGSVTLHGAYYDFVNGVYEHWDFVNGKPGPKQIL